MLAKYTMAGVVGSALLATVAFAQTPSSENKAAASSEKSAPISEQSLKGDWRASKVVGLNVYNNNNEKIGSINDLLLDKSGNIKAVVVGVGGFLGMGEHLVAIGFDKLKFSDEPVSYTSASGSNPSANRPASSTTTGAANTNSASTTKNPWYPDHAVFNATKDELKAMPEFKYST
jgi:sporulation protein YlmC with PRC-barrel domain